MNPINGGTTADFEPVFSTPPTLTHILLLAGPRSLFIRHSRRRLQNLNFLFKPTCEFSDQYVLKDGSAIIISDENDHRFDDDCNAGQHNQLVNYVNLGSG